MARSHWRRDNATLRFRLNAAGSAKRKGWHSIRSDICRAPAGMHVQTALAGGELPELQTDIVRPDS
jgi:hypothetical protein